MCQGVLGLEIGITHTVLLGSEPLFCPWDFEIEGLEFSWAADFK
jgi:hypothetical protein